MHLYNCPSVRLPSPLAQNFVYPEDGSKKFMKDSKGARCPRREKTLLGNTAKQRDSSTKGSTSTSSKETETEATKGTHAFLPTSELSPTDILNQHKARFLKTQNKQLSSHFIPV